MHTPAPHWLSRTLEQAFMQSCQFHYACPVPVILRSVNNVEMVKRRDAAMLQMSVLGFHSIYMRVLYNTSKLPLLTQMAWFIFQTLLRRIALAAPGSVAWSGYETNCSPPIN